MQGETHLAQRVTAGVTFAARLSFEDIHHSYGPDAVTLRGITLSAEPGEVLCLLGPSGSGKTTLLRIAAGIEAQTSGRVLLNDREIAGPDAFLPPEQRSIGLVFQDFALFPHLSIVDNVRFGLTALSKTESRKEALIALERVGLAGYADSFPHVLSGGEQQRVALARALAREPELLLLDEPTASLDPAATRAVEDIITMAAQSGIKIVMASHDLGQVRRLAGEVAFLVRGRLCERAAATDFFDRPSTREAAAFVRGDLVI